MDIKQNIDKEVLNVVASKMNVTEDLLIQMISSDLHNKTMIVLSVVVIALLLGIFLGLMSYFQFKKSSKQKYSDTFFAELFGIASGLILGLSLLIFGLTGAYHEQFEVIYNHEYAVIKEVNEIYNEIVNPAQSDENQ